MSDATDRERALSRLISLTEPDAEPQVTADELDAILDNHLVGSAWSASEVLPVGVTRLPTVRNGRQYIVVQSGTTSATEPVWPTGFNTSYQRRVYDGSVIFEDAGAAISSIYDVQAAALEVWDKKCAKASQYISTPGIDMAKIYDRCVEMRDRFEPVLIA